jgi:dUTP pyrophosphatase
MKLGIKLLDDSATMPTKAHDGDACYDIRSSQHGVISPGGRVLFLTGIAMEIPDGYCVMIYSRSGMGAKRGIRLANSIGVIDAGYKNEIMVCLTNDSPEPYTVLVGDKIAQFKVEKLEPIELVQVQELSDSDRGTGGFGSSGK